MHCRRKERNTNNDTLEANWLQLKGKVKEKWGNFTDQDLEVIVGKRDQLVGKLQERYGMAKAAAVKQINEFEKRHSSTKTAR